MSDRWATAITKATMRPPENTGAAIVASGRWPVPIHGSFVKKMSPGCRFSRGIFFSIPRSDSGAVPMKPGMLSDDCAISRASLSRSTQAKSLDSRTTVENEVRLSAAPASSAMAIRRFQ